MAKRKQPEEDTSRPDHEVVEDPSADHAEEVKDDGFVNGWTIGEATIEEGVSDPVTTVKTDSEGEDGWEAEALWALLVKAGYQLW